MRQVGLMSLLATTFFVFFPLVSNAQPALNQSDAQFGFVQPNTVKTIQVIISVPATPRGYYRLDAPILTSASPSLSATLSGQDVNSFSPVTLTIKLTAGTAPAKVSDSLVISYRRSDGDGPQAGALSIPVTGEILCAIGSVNCNPSIPLCNADEHFPLQYVNAPSAAIDKMVSAQSAHRKLHNAGDDTYELGFDLLVNVAGLSSYLHVPPVCPSVVSQCTQKCDCMEPFQFTHIAGAPRVAGFKWTGQMRKFSTPSSLPDWKIELSIPNSMDGFAVVTAGYNEYMFDINSRPSLTVSYLGAAIYDGPIACLSARTNRAHIKHPQANGNRPKVDLIIER